jgi:pimeloyl-ACP methyl ester carboxylesterase
VLESAKAARLHKTAPDGGGNLCRSPPPNNTEEEPIMASKQQKISIVFVHGIWADGSCFSRVIPALLADGHEVIAAQYGLNSAATDVAAVKYTLQRVSAPVLLIGHSYGGTLITAAGTDPRVAGLLYIAALAPDSDETSQGQQDKFPRTDVFSHVEVENGRAWMTRDGASSFAGDLPREEQQLVWATYQAPDADLFNQKVEGTAWRSKPSWYIVATQDRTVNPELQRFAAKRMGAKTSEVASSHVPMLSQPKVVLDVIRDAVKTLSSPLQDTH